MEDWQREYILNNLKELLQNTHCSVQFLSKLTAYLSESDEAALEAKLSSLGRLAQNQLFYEIALQKTGIYEAIVKALFETKQSIAFLLILNGYFGQNKEHVFDICNIDYKNERLWQVLEGIGYKALKCTVTLQAHATTLENALQNINANTKKDILDNALKGNFLAELVNGNKPKIFSNTVPEPPSYYIGRRLTFHNILDPAIFLKSSRDVFVFRGIQKYEIRLLNKDYSIEDSGNQTARISSRFIILERSEDFDKICKISKHPVHLIEHEGGTFISVKSHGDISLIQTFACEKQDVTDEMEFIKLCLNSATPVCISDSPGMGKTALLSNLAHIIMKMHPLRLVQYIVLREFVTEVEKFGKGKIGKQLLIQIIAQHASENEFGRQVVQHILKSGCQTVELMFDGYDEVLFSQIQTTNNILHIILQLKSVRVYVATRPHMKNELENILGTIGYNIEAFGKSEQLEFLTKYWGQQKTTSTENKRLLKFANHCLKALQQTMNDFERNFAGIPLRCKLLAEVYEKDATRYMKPETRLTKYEAGLVIRIESVFQLFLRLIDLRFARLFSKFSEKQLKFFMRAHMYASLQLMFPENAPDFKYILIECFDFDLRDIYSIGILEKTLTNDSTPRFVHRTFAEYFLGLFIVTMINEYSENNERPFFNKSLFDSLFFNNMLQTIPYTEQLLNSFDTTCEPIQLMKFKHPVVCYFINAHLSCSAVPPARPIPWIDNAYQLYNALLSCASQDYLALYTKLLDPEEHKQLQQKNGSQLSTLHLIAAKYSTLDLFKIVQEHVTEVPDFKGSYLQSRKPRFMITPLHVATERGCYTIVEFILNEKLSPQGHKFLLHCCVACSTQNTDSTISQKMQVIRILASMWPQALNEMKTTEISPLLEQNVHLKLLETLVKSGADVNTFNLQGCVLHRLSDITISPQTFHQMILLLLTHGFNQFDATDTSKRTPLHRAIEKSELLDETVQVFHIMKANFNAEDELGDSILFYAIKAERSVNFLDLLLAFGAKLRHKNKNSDNILHVCARTGYNDALQHFLTSDNIQIDDIIAKNTNQLSPFILGMEIGKGLKKSSITCMEKRGFLLTRTHASEALKALICNKNVLTYEKITDFVEVADYLLLKGAVITCRNGRLPWDLEATRKNLQAIIEATRCDELLLEELGIRGVSLHSLTTVDETQHLVTVPPYIVNLLSSLKTRRFLQNNRIRPKLPSATIYKAFSLSQQNTFERLCISLVSCKQLKPFLRLKQCIQSDEEVFTTFATLPKVFVDFMANKQNNVLALRTWDSKLSIERIKELITSEIHEITLDDLHSSTLPSGLSIYSCEVVTNQLLSSLMKSERKTICLCKDVQKGLRKEYTVNIDEIAWEHFSKDFQTQLESIVSLRWSSKDLPQNFFSLLEDDALTSLIRDFDFQLVEFHADDNPDTAMYLSNTLFHYFIPDKLVFHGISKEELEEHTLFGQKIGETGDDINTHDYLLVEDEEEYDNLSKYTDTAIHFIKFTEGRFEFIRSVGSSNAITRFLESSSSKPEKCRDFPLCTCGNHPIGSPNFIWNVFQFPNQNLKCWINVFDMFCQPKNIEFFYSEMRYKLVQEFKSMTKHRNKMEMWKHISSKFKLRADSVNPMDIENLLSCSKEECRALEKIALNNKFPVLLNKFEVSGVDRYINAGLLIQKKNSQLVFVHECFSSFFLAKAVLEEHQIPILGGKPLIDMILEDCFELKEDSVTHSWWNDSKFCSETFQSYKFINGKLFHYLDFLVQSEPLTSIVATHLMENASVEFVRKWIHACVNDNLSNLLSLVIEYSLYTSVFASVDIVLLAVKYANIEVIDLILELYFQYTKQSIKDIKIQITLSKGNKKDNLTVLHVAALRGSFSIVQYLLNYQGFSIVQYLLNHQDFQDIIKTINMQTLIGCCLVDTQGLDSELKERFGILSLLLRLCPSLIQNSNFVYPKIHVELILNMINAGSNVLANLSFNNDIILHLVSEYMTPQEFHEMVLHFTSKKNFNILNVRNKNDATPLSKAVQHLELLDETIKLFSLADADFNNTEINNISVLIRAIISHRSARVLNSLIKAGADIHHRTLLNWTAVHHAADKNNLTALRYLIANGCQYQVTETGDFDVTPLHLALEFPQLDTLEIIKLLVQYGANINALDDRNESPASVVSAKQKGVFDKSIEDFLKQQQNQNKTMHTNANCQSQPTLDNQVLDREVFTSDWRKHKPQELFFGVDEALSLFCEGKDDPQWKSCRIVGAKLGHKICTKKFKPLSKKLFQYLLHDKLAFIGLGLEKLKEFAKHGQTYGNHSESINSLDCVVLQNEPQFHDICAQTAANVHLIEYKHQAFQLLRSRGSDKHIEKFIKKGQLCENFPQCSCVGDSADLYVDLTFQILCHENHVTNLQIPINEILPSMRKKMFEDSTEFFEVLKMFKKLYKLPFGSKTWAVIEKRPGFQLNTTTDKLIHIVRELFTCIGWKESDNMKLTHVAVNTLFPDFKRKIETCELKKYINAGVVAYEEGFLAFAHKAFAFHFLIEFSKCHSHFLVEFSDMTLSNTTKSMFCQCIEPYNLIIAYPTITTIQIHTLPGQTFVYKHSGFFEFLESSVKQHRTTNGIKQFLKDNLSTEQIFKWIHACANANQFHLFKLLVSLKTTVKLFKETSSLAVIAVKICNIPILRLVVENYVAETNKDFRSIDVLLENDYDVSILHIAAMRGDYSVMYYLLHNVGFKEILHYPNMKDLLHYCIFDTYNLGRNAILERKKILELLLKTSPSLVQSKDRFNRSPLLQHLAHVDLLIHMMQLGMEAETTLLLFVPACIRPKEYDKLAKTLYTQQKFKMFQARNSLQQTALHKAMYLEVLNSTIELFFLAGADINAADTEMSTVLIEAIMRQRSARVLSSLIHAGADIHKRGPFNESVLHIAAARGNFTAVKYFTLLGFDINVSDDKGSTPLHLAMQFSKQHTEDIMELLLEHGGCVNGVDNDGNSVISKAIKGGRDGCFLKNLIKQGADWKLVNIKKETLLHFSVQYGNLQATELFISLGCNVNATNCDNSTPLHLALFSKENTLQILDVLVQHQSDVNAVNDRGETVVMTAIRAGRDHSILDSLIEAGGNWTFVTEQGLNMLHFAAACGNLAAVKLLISKGCDVNEEGACRSNPLHFAVRFSEKNTGEIVQELIKHGCDVNSVNSSGHSVIIVAIINGRDELLLRLLVRLGADYKKLYKNNFTPMHYAAYHGNLHALKLLISFRCNVNTLTDNSYTPLHIAVLFAETNCQEVVLALCKNGSNVNAIDDKGESILASAIRQLRDVSILNILIEFGADWKKSNKQQESVFHLAVKSKNLVALKFFTKLGSDVNSTAKYGRTPLHYSVLYLKQEALDIILHLMQEGANFNAIDNRGSSAFLNAISIGCDATILNTLISFGADYKLCSKGEYSALHVAAESGNVSATKLLISLGADVRTRTVHNSTPLHLAVLYAKSNTEEIVQLLVENGADFNAVDNDGDSVLSEAIRGGQQDLFLLNMIQLGADWTISNNLQESPIHWAAEVGNLSALKLFISFDYDVNLSNLLGCTPLHMAFQGKTSVHDVVSELLRHGADVNAKNKDGQTPIDLAYAQVLNGQTEQQTLDLLISMFT